MFIQSNAKNLFKDVSASLNMTKSTKKTNKNEKDKDSRTSR